MIAWPYLEYQCYLKKKPASLVTGEGMSFYIKINQELMVMDTDSFGVFPQETEILLCDSFFERYSGYKMLKTIKWNNILYDFKFSISPFHFVKTL